MDSITTLFVVRGLAAIAAIVGATYLASIDKEGWGWLVFAAIVIGTVNYKGD